LAQLAQLFLSLVGVGAHLEPARGGSSGLYATG